MSWLVLTEDHLKVKISGPELAAFRAAALATSQADPVDDAIEQAVNMVRGYIAGCSRNTLSEGLTIPDKLIRPTVDIVVMDIMTRAAGTVIDPEGQRGKAYDRAITLLEQVAACRFAVEEPEADEETDENFGVPDPRITYTEPSFTRAQQDGI